MLTTIALIVALILLTALAVLQLLVGFGLPLGNFVWGGAHRVLPRKLRTGSFLSILLYLGFAILLLSRAHVLPGGENTAIVVLTWVLFAYFTLGILMNAISRSPVERATITPTSAVLAVTTLIIALG